MALTPYTPLQLFGAMAMGWGCSLLFIAGVITLFGSCRRSRSHHGDKLMAAEVDPLNRREVNDA